jgi:hypothetical protein
MRRIASTSLLPDGSAQTPDRSAWMRDAKWGVMTHYLADWIARTSGEKMSIERVTIWSTVSIRLRSRGGRPTVFLVLEVLLLFDRADRLSS